MSLRDLQRFQRYLLPEHLAAGSEKVAAALDFTTKEGGGK